MNQRWIEGLKRLLKGKPRQKASGKASDRSDFDRFWYRWPLRLMGWATVILFTLFGLPVLMIFLIGGLWHGFGQAAYVLQFLVFFVYLIGTIFLGFRLAFRPTPRLAWMVAVCWLIVVVFAMLTPQSEPGSGVDHERPQSAEPFTDTLSFTP